VRRAKVEKRRGYPIIQSNAAIFTAGDGHKDALLLGLLAFDLDCNWVLSLLHLGAETQDAVGVPVGSPAVQRT